MTNKILPRLRCPECKELMEWNKVHICKIPQEIEEKLMLECIKDFEDYMINSFNFITELPPSILLSNNKELTKIQKAKDLMCDDIVMILKKIQRMEALK